MNKRHKKTDEYQASRATWEKEVVRIVSMHIIRDKNGVTEVKAPAGKASFSRLLIDAAKQGRLTVFDNLDSAALSQDKVIDITAIPPDTFMVDDPITGMQYIKTTPAYFDYNHVLKFKVLEKWSYFKDDRSTQIRTIAIAPLKDVYGQDGTYRGEQTMFWVRWADALPFLKDYNAYDTVNSFEDLLWRTYFRDSSMIADTLRCALAHSHGNIRTMFTIRQVSINGSYDEQEYVRNLRPLTPEATPLASILFGKLVSGAIKSYSAPCTSHMFSIADIYKMIEPIKDTLLIEDPETGNIITKIISSSFAFETHTEYHVWEEWSYDMDAGITRISHGWMAPVHSSYNEYSGKRINEVPMLWIRLKDIKNELDKFAAYNPGNNLDWQLWISPFMEKKRPVETELFTEYK